jgi:hypothetical protein
MSLVVQQASIAAWNDEAHVVANRELYRASSPRSRRCWPGDGRALPDAGFYLWADVADGDDIAFARELLAQYNVAVLPGSLLAREAHGQQPGRGRVRMALVAGCRRMPRGGPAHRRRHPHRLLCRKPTMTSTLQKSIIDLAWEGRASSRPPASPAECARPSST